MTFVPVMWVVWGFIALVTTAFWVYRSNLTKDEEDQIFLDDSFDHEKAAQQAIVAKVNKIEPLLRICNWTLGVATVLVIAYYVMDIYRQFE